MEDQESNFHSAMAVAMLIGIRTISIPINSIFSRMLASNEMMALAILIRIAVAMLIRIPCIRKNDKNQKHNFPHGGVEEEGGSSRNGCIERMHGMAALNGCIEWMHGMDALNLCIEWMP